MCLGWFETMSTLKSACVSWVMISLYLNLDCLEKNSVFLYCPLFWFPVQAGAADFVLRREEYFLLLSTHKLTEVNKSITVNNKAWQNPPLCAGGGSSPFQWTFFKVTKQTFPGPSTPLATSLSSSQFSSLFLQINPPILHHSPGANFEGQLI